MRILLVLTTAIALLPAAGVQAGPRQALLAELTVQAKADDAGFREFSASRGETLFRTRFTGGKPKTPSCTTCHTTSPLQAGETRAGKAIKPMAVSVTPKRFMDPKKVAKWFRRNCKSVLGRECTAREKGDFLSFMISQ